MTNPNNAIGTNGAFGGRTSPNALNDVLSGLKGTTGTYKGAGILSGWQVSAASADQITLGGDGLNRDVAIAADPNGNFVTVNNISEQPVSVTMPSKPTSGSRLDGVVVYVQNPPQGTSTVVDNPGACGIIGVAGGGSTILSDTTIRNAITADGGEGATAYYAVLATVRRSWSETTINRASVTLGKDLSGQYIRDNLLINRRPIWDTLLSTHVGTENQTLTVTSQLGKTYTLYSANGGAGIHFPSQSSLRDVNMIESWSSVRYNSVIEDKDLRVNGIATGSRVYTTVIGTNSSGTGVGPRSAVNTTDPGVQYASVVSMKGASNAIAVHYIGQRLATSSTWIYFAEAKVSGSQTNYAGSFECTAVNDTTIPGLYQMGTIGIVSSCRHIVKLFYQ